MKLKVFLAGLIIATCNLTNVANAHLIAFGWDDLDNGTIEMYGQHWHGDQSSAFSDNGGVRIGLWDNALSAGNQNTASWQLFQWTSFINNMGGNTAQNDALVSAGTLDGYAIDVGNWRNDSSHNDWFKTSPLVLGNGSWGVFTGTACCADTMTTPIQITLTGISSVQSGTGPGSVSVPEPSTLAIFALGMIGLTSRRFKKKS